MSAEPIESASREASREAREASERGHYLTPYRRAFLVEHAQQPGWTTGRIAAELGVPPYIVSAWLARRDIAEAIQGHTFDRVKADIARLANTPRVRSEGASSTRVAHGTFIPSQPAPAPQPYAGVEVTESGAILTPDLKAALLGKVRALCAEQGKEVMRNELRAELRELVFDTVRRALAELVEALESLTSEAGGGVDGKEYAGGEHA